MKQQDPVSDREMTLLVARLRSVVLCQPSSDLSDRIFAAPEPTRFEVGAWLALTAASLFFCLTFRPAPTDLPQRLQVGDIVWDKTTPSWCGFKQHYEYLTKEIGQ